LRNLLVKPILLFTVVLVFSSLGRAESSNGEAAKDLPDRIGTFRAQRPAEPEIGGENAATLVELSVSSAVRTYFAENGHSIVVSVFKTRKDASAFSLLTLQRQNDEEVRLGEIGTASVVAADRVSFAKGNTFVTVLSVRRTATKEELVELSHSLAELIDAGENQIPVLVKHLPDWERAMGRSLYSVTLQTLKRLLPNQGVFDAVSFEGGTEAVAADYYGPQQLLVVEFNTASLATDNDQRIKTKLQELGSQGQPVPTAYRRVGNYAVFVFNAPNEQAANQLIDQVKYQQVVQWLGEDPFVYERATREFTETTLGVFVSVVKASGLALAACFAVGGFFGALLFSVRRAQQRAREAYSDSGAILRLNLDELTPESDPARLLGRGN
jgi:uncharacterized DUF497 family protein